MTDISQKKEDKKDEYPTINVQGFNEKDANDMKMLAELNNSYIALIQQYEAAKKNILGIKTVLNEVETDKIKIDKIRVPYGIGLTRNLSIDEKPEFLKIYNDALNAEHIKINALLGQITHKGDTLGEHRMRILRILFGLLINQHNFNRQELINILSGGTEQTGFKDADKITEKINTIIEGAK